MRAITPDLYKPAERGSALTEPSSPRSTYILGCLSHKMNPRASLLIRKKLTRELHLQHYGMGDTMAVRLSESLKLLPFVNHVNLADNNLTDTGLKPIIESILQMQNLTYLNLSENKM